MVGNFVHYISKLDKIIVTDTKKGLINVFDGKTNQFSNLIEAEMDSIDFVEISKNENSVIFISKYGTCKFFNAHDFKLIRTVKIISSESKTHYALKFNLI
jgi:hypothetical protein